MFRRTVPWCVLAIACGAAEPAQRSIHRDPTRISTAVARGADQCMAGAAAEVACETTDPAATRSWEEFEEAYQTRSDETARATRMASDVLGSLRRDAHAFRCAGPSAELLYAEARLWFESGRYGEAAALFDEVARDPACGDLCLFAVMLELDSLNQAYRAGEPCLDRMRIVVEDALERECTGRDTDREGYCEEWTALRDQILARQ